eukprot:TRINITY_DN50228_c0_g1_i1.p2 TRINITY_DN50228_c0_g1~~TRINITY_DN50228_c0_g1_i1.p2  ORF type:complete len:643 (+),score=219.31 TRINITY_DN50228_c0_g1_i1:80-1930(+)
MPPGREGGAPPAYADVLEAAAKHPVYEKLIKAAGGKDFTITKEEYHLELERDEKGACGPDFGGILWLQSGGMVTTRKWYTPVLQSEWAQQHERVRDLAHRLGMLSAGSVVVPLLGDVVEYPLYHEIAEMVRHCGATLLSCDASSSDEAVIRTAKRFKGNTVVGSRARLVQLAWHLTRERRRYPFCHVLVYGELPTPTQQRLLDKAFSDLQHGKTLRPRMAGIFGTAELGLLGFSPHQLRDLRTIIFDSAALRVTVEPCGREESPPTKVRRTAEVFENQKRYPMVGWQSKAVPGGGGGGADRFEVWTTREGVPCRREQVKLPGEEYGTWEWQGKWQPDADWEYAADFRGPWAADEATVAGQGKGDAKFRRRRWAASMVKIDAAPELEAGRLLATLLCRTRCPILNYDTGDLAKQGDVVFAGDKYPAFRLGGRRLNRFTVGARGGGGGVSLFVCEFAVPLFHYLLWQLVIDSVQDEAGAVDRITVYAVPPFQKKKEAVEQPAALRSKLSPFGGGNSPRSRGAGSPRAAHSDPAADDPDAPNCPRAVAARVRKALQEPRDAPLPDFRIEFVPCTPHDLRLHEASGRLRPMIDTRVGGGGHARVGKSAAGRRRGASDGVD